MPDWKITLYFEADTEKEANEKAAAAFDHILSSLPDGVDFTAEESFT